MSSKVRISRKREEEEEEEEEEEDISAPALRASLRWKLGGEWTNMEAAAKMKRLLSTLLSAPAGDKAAALSALLLYTLRSQATEALTAAEEDYLLAHCWAFRPSTLELLVKEGASLAVLFANVEIEGATEEETINHPQAALSPSSTAAVVGSLRDAAAVNGINVVAFQRILTEEEHEELERLKAARVSVRKADSADILLSNRVAGVLLAATAALGSEVVSLWGMAPKPVEVDLEALYTVLPNLTEKALSRWLKAHEGAMIPGYGHFSAGNMGMKGPERAAAPLLFAQALSGISSSTASYSSSSSSSSAAFSSFLSTAAAAAADGPQAAIVAIRLSLQAGIALLSKGGVKGAGSLIKKALVELEVAGFSADDMERIIASLSSEDRVRKPEGDVPVLKMIGTCQPEVVPVSEDGMAAVLEAFIAERPRGSRRRNLLLTSENLAKQQLAACPPKNYERGVEYLVIIDGEESYGGSSVGNGSAQEVLGERFAGRHKDASSTKSRDLDSLALKFQGIIRGTTAAPEKILIYYSEIVPQTGQQDTTFILTRSKEFKTIEAVWELKGNLNKKQDSFDYKHLSAEAAAAMGECLIFECSSSLPAGLCLPSALQSSRAHTSLSLTLCLSVRAPLFPSAAADPPPPWARGRRH